METENKQQKSLVQVFTSPTCPHCPPTKKLVESVINERDDAVYQEMSTVTPEGSMKAREYGIMSVPTIIITGPASDQPIGIAGLPPKKGLEKAINISLGLDKFKEDKSKKGFLSNLFKTNKSKQ